MKSLPIKHRSLEVMLVLTTVALTCVLHEMSGYKIVVLNLFYLPVILAAFYLGRFRAGVLAFFTVIVASIVTSLDLNDFAANNSPLVIGLSVLVWGSVLGLASLLVGTLSDELASRIDELHEAHVGVVEVLSRYLQSAHPRLKDRSHRVAELCHEVAVQLRLSLREVDNIRVAALLHDMENIEITARVIRKAVGDLEDESKGTEQRTFHGTELVHSLGHVLMGAFPLVLNQAETEQTHTPSLPSGEDTVPFGARIIRTVRAYDALMNGRWSTPGARPADVIEDLRRDTEAHHHPTILNALERVVSHRQTSEKTALLVAANAPEPVGAF